MMNTSIISNVEGVLSRNEMKKIMAGGSPCGSTCCCTSSDGCSVNFNQNEHTWSYSVNCGGSYQFYNGPGQYEGSLCGGQCPSTELEVN